MDADVHVLPLVGADEHRKPALQRVVLERGDGGVVRRPVVAGLDREVAVGELLAELGFEIEPYGERDYALRAIPDDIDVGEAAAAIEEICEKLRKGKDLSPENARDEILHTVACKAAIKAGRSHDRAELERIAKAVCAGEVKYCPHGRPVSVSLTKKELDKFFSRIV